MVNVSGSLLYSCGFYKSVYIIVYYLTYCFLFIHNLLYFNKNRHMTKKSMRAGNVDVYGFLEPQSIQRSGQSHFESESYIKNWMQNSKKDVYQGAYLNGSVKISHTFILYSCCAFSFFCMTCS